MKMMEPSGQCCRTMYAENGNAIWLSADCLVTAETALWVRKVYKGELSVKIKKEMQHTLHIQSRAQTEPYFQ